MSWFLWPSFACEKHRRTRCSYSCSCSSLRRGSCGSAEPSAAADSRCCFIASAPYAPPPTACGT